MMNITQLEYLVAVDNERHFVKAANQCNITQATLSMMIKKLEDELGVKVFDRSKQPVRPTKDGLDILKKARIIIAAATELKNYAKDIKGEVTGEVHLGIIPTLAPYLLPLFLRSFALKYPMLKIFIKEMITGEIISKLKSGELDMGLLAAPLKEPSIQEVPLFFEEFFAYASRQEKLSKKKYLLPSEILPDHLWLLEEGHCLRNQVFDLCELKKQDFASDKLHYEAGSIETLINLVDKNEGITIIPQLAVMLLKQGQKKNVREFARPAPGRRIVLASARHYPRTKIHDVLKEEILMSVPKDIIRTTKK